MIYIVDDEPLILELTSSILAPLGMPLRTFRDGGPALEAFAQSNPKPALVVTDYAMQVMNGLELLEGCRRINPAQKFLLLSGTVDESFFADHPIRPDAFMAKPFRPDQFLGLVKRLVSS